MATEDLTGTDKFVDDLVATNPVATDSVSDGDEHIRGVKNVLKNTLPNVTAAVTATAADLNKTSSTFTGADGSAAGASGMVTAPVATDNTKFLKGDGTWATPAGGGGSSTLGGLTDVDTSAITLIDGAVLRYNGTASEWQNTNLGLSLTPTVTIPSTIYPSPTTVTITITNWSSYSSPAPWCEVENSSGTVVVAASAVTNNGDGTMTFTSPSTAATYTLKVKVQDFGDLVSSTVSTSMVVSESPSYEYRYFRIGSLGSTGSGYLAVVEFYTSAGFTGTYYPPAMTSNSQTIGGVTYALSGYSYNTTSYQLWKMTDTSGYDPTKTGAWMLGASATQKSDGWVFDLGTARDIASARCKWYTYSTPNTYHSSPFTLYGSSNGSSWTSINTVTMGATNDGEYVDMLLG